MSKSVQPAYASWGLRVVLVLVSVEVSLQLLGVGYQWWSARAHTSPVTDSEFTILCLGDSHTFGIGAKPQESYPRQLEQLLASRWPTRRIRVVNAGVPGFNTSQVLHRLASHLEEVQPDLLLLLVGLNDQSEFFEIDFASLEAVPLSWRTHLSMRLNHWLSHLRLSRLAKRALFLRGKGASRISPQPPAESPTTVGAPEPSRANQRSGKGEWAELWQAQERSRTGEGQEVLQAQAERYMEHREMHQAQLVWEQLVEQEPTNFIYYEQLANVQLLQGAHEDAIATARTAVKVDPSNAESWFLLAWIAKEVGRLKQAREVWREAFRQTHHLSALGKLGGSYKDPDEARKAMRTLLEETQAASPHEPAYWAPYERLIDHGVHIEAVQRLVRANLEQIVNRAVAKGVRVGLLTYPSEGRNEPPNTELIQVAAALHPEVLLIDAAQHLSGRFLAPGSGLLDRRREHPSAQGYELLARYVLEALRTSDALATLTRDTP